MAHGHHHHELNSKNLLIATILNSTITVLELIGGIISNSLALLSDAVHNLGDTIAVLLAWLANNLSKQKPNTKKTFGYKRVEILTAVLNSVILIAITIYLFLEAYKRFLEPEPIKGLVMFIVATVGLLANLISVLILRKDSRHNINVKAAYLHLLGDTISSVAVIIGSVLIYFFKVYWIDPLITVIIGLYILKEAIAILKEAVEILMQSTPSNINIEQVVEKLERKYPEISNVHHVHSWRLDDHEVHFECHIDLKHDEKISKLDLLRLDIESYLNREFNIGHVTIQFEFDCCEEKQVIR